MPLFSVGSDDVGSESFFALLGGKSPAEFRDCVELVLEDTAAGLDGDGTLGSPFTGVGAGVAEGVEVGVLVADEGLAIKLS